MAFSDDAWAGIGPVYDAILAHPFVAELAEGTLGEERFRFYMIQDALYLVAFGRALALAGARADRTDSLVKFATAAHEAVVVERTLHESYFARFGASPDQAARAQPSPTCFAYSNFLVASAANAPYPVAVAALLPCFWIYWEVGKTVLGRAGATNPYRAWIDSYADEAFGAAVGEIIAIADAVAEEATPSMRADMRAAFGRAAVLEWMFWDSAYRLESWPLEAPTVAP